MDAVRLRVVFVDRDILSRSQKSEELNRTWLLLNPIQHQTIGDLSSHLTHIFDLHHSCPNGIHLFMDDFLLPPFESTCILKDKDLIRVKRKGGASGEIVDAGDSVTSIKGDDSADKKLEGPSVLILANEEFDTEFEGQKSAGEEKEKSLTANVLLVGHSTDENAGFRRREESGELQRKKVKKKSGTFLDTAEVAKEKKMISGKEILEKQLIANGEFETKTSGYQSELEEKRDDLAEGLLLAENIPVTDVEPKKREASNELQSPSVIHRKKKKCVLRREDIETDFQEQSEPGHSPKRKKKKLSLAHQDIKSDSHSEQSKPSYSQSSGMNVDNEDKVSDLKSKDGRESASGSVEGNGEVVDERCTMLHENGTESVDVLLTSEGTKKVSRSARRIKAKRQWRKELKAEAKELLAENIPLFYAQSPERSTQMGGLEYQQHNQTGEANGPIVIRPGHIRFEPFENDQSVKQRRVVVETFESIGVTSKRKNRKWGKEKFVYCTRSNCRDPYGECLRVVTMEKAKPPNDPSAFYKLPLLTSCPQEGDIIAYRVLEQSTDLGPVFSSFRVGKTLRFDRWLNTLLLTPVQAHPYISEMADQVTQEQQLDNSVDSESGYLEIDVSLLFDVRIVRHAPTAGKDVNVWDDLSQAASVKNSLLIQKKEWGKPNLTPTGTSIPSKEEWREAGPTASSDRGKDVNVWDDLSQAARAKNSLLIQKREWRAPNLTSTSTSFSSKKEWGKPDPSSSSWKAEREKDVNAWDHLSQAASVKNSLLIQKKEWRKPSEVGPTTSSWRTGWGKPDPKKTSSNKDWENAVPTTTSSKKQWGNVSPAMTSSKKEWGNAGSVTTSSKKEWSSVGPTVTVWKADGGKLSSTTTSSKKEWGNAGPTMTTPGPTTTSWKKEWGKPSPTTTASKREWVKMGPTTSSSKTGWGEPSSTTTSSKKEWCSAGATTSSWKKG